MQLYNSSAHAIVERLIFTGVLADPGRVCMHCKHERAVVCTSTIACIAKAFADKSTSDAVTALQRTDCYTTELLLIMHIDGYVH